MEHLSNRGRARHYPEHRPGAHCALRLAPGGAATDIVARGTRHSGRARRPGRPRYARGGGHQCSGGAAGRPDDPLGAPSDRVPSGCARHAPGADTLLDTHRVLETLLEKVRIFAGRVEELSPTSVGASFGLEDLEEAPRRAAHAAMAVRRALERRPVHDAPAFTARVGLHVAQLLVSRTSGPPEIDGDGKRAAWAALDALLETAEPGTVAVSAAAGTLLERRFSLAPLLSGDPTGYRLLGHERTGLRAQRRMASFVGRRQELDLLQSRLATATTSSGQVIGITGEAGIGKSRLLYEFRQRLRGRHVTWLEAHCVSYGGNIPHLPLLELLRHGCRIDEYDTPEVVADKVRHALERVDIDPAEAAPYLLQFLGVKPASAQVDKLSPEAIQARTVQVLRRMIVQASRRRPLILVVEDLHWVDAASTALASLIEGLDRISVLVLFTYRPGYKLPWMDRSFTTQIALQPLTPEESAVVVSSMLESASVPGGDAGLSSSRRMAIPSSSKSSLGRRSSSAMPRRRRRFSRSCSPASIACPTRPGACSRRPPCSAAKPRCVS